MPDSTHTGGVQRTKSRRLLYGFIIVMLVANCAYAAFQVFVTMAPPGGSGLPLFGNVDGLSDSDLLVRRGYAIEFWISFVGLSLFVAITERRSDLHSSAATDR